MDERTGKHLAKGLRTTMANIHVDGVEKLLSSVFILLLSATEE
jgi:hypothetical protein